jgi:class 3 adenylate cyclase
VVGVFMARRNQRVRSAEFESRKRTEQLLLNIQPEDIATELRDRERVQARNVEACTILFSDFVGFTALSARVHPAELVTSLDTAFHRFDRITADHGLEKLKTIGDAYMCAGGVMEAHPDHLDRCLRAGLAMMAALEDPALRDPEGNPWRMRLGLHTGPVVAGVIGAHKFAFDLWGDTVNVAARAESAGRPGGVCMSAEVFAPLADRYAAEALGEVELKGKGPVAMVLVTGPRT